MKGEKNHGHNGSLTRAEQTALDAVVSEVRDERRRQALDLGRTPEHDDTHTAQTMVDLTRSYLNRATDDLASWPSDSRVSEARDNLLKAAALLVATVERLDREVSRG